MDLENNVINAIDVIERFNLPIQRTCPHCGDEFVCIKRSSITNGRIQYFCEIFCMNMTCNPFNNDPNFIIPIEEQSEKL